jgi:O-antigen/teichoic acid export membrane protein
MLTRQEAIAPEPSSEAGAAPPPTADSFGLVRDRSLAHSVVWNAAGDWLSQLLSWAAFLIVVRVVPPADFGIAAMAVLLLPYMNLVIAFGIPRAVVTLRDLSEHQLAQLNSVSLAISLGFLLVALAIARPFAAFFHSPRLAPVLMVVSTSLLLVGIQGVPAAIMAKQLRFRLLTMLGAGSAVVAATATLVLALSHFGYWALVLGNLAGAVCRTILILRFQPCRLAWPHRNDVREPLHFGARIMISMIASNSYSNLDNFVAGRTLGDTALGLYGAAWEFANLPVEKITTLVTTVLPSYLSTVQDQPAMLRRYLRSMTETIALATFPASVGLGLVAPDLVPLVFGERWRGMVGPLQVLSFYAGFRSVFALLPKFLVAVGEVNYAVWNDVAALILLPTAFYVGSRHGITGIAWGWIVAYPLVALPLCRKTLRVLDLSVREYVGVLWPALEATIAMVFTVILVRLALPPSLHIAGRLILEVAIGAVTYVGTIAVRHNDRLRAVMEMARRLLSKRSEVGTFEATS